MVDDAVGGLDSRIGPSDRPICDWAERMADHQACSSEDAAGAVSSRLGRLCTTPSLERLLRIKQLLGHPYDG